MSTKYSTKNLNQSYLLLVQKEIRLLNKSDIDINFIKGLFEADKLIAEKFHFSKCKYETCSGVYHQSNYTRKPRGISPEADKYFAFRFSFCCSLCRLRFTCKSVRFLGRKVYPAHFIMVILNPQAEEIHKKLLPLPPQTISSLTIRRWFSWWHLTVPQSSVWKTLVGLVVANIKKIFLPIFLMELFLEKHSDFKKSLFNILEFISPISIPANYPHSDSALLWNKSNPHKMKVLKLINLPYIKRSG